VHSRSVERAEKSWEVSRRQTLGPKYTRDRLRGGGVEVLTRPAKTHLDMAPRLCAGHGIEIARLHRCGRDDLAREELDRLRGAHPVLYYASMLIFVGICEGWLDETNVVRRSRQASVLGGLAGFVAWLEARAGRATGPRAAS
jgi:hypothetical protein